MEQKQQQQNIKAGLDACWQQYCALRQGVLEAANATGYPISKISQLDMKLEQVSCRTTAANYTST